MCILIEKSFTDFPEFDAWKVTAKGYLRITPDLWYTGPFSTTRVRRGDWLTAEIEPEHKKRLREEDKFGFSVFEAFEDAEIYASRLEARITEIEKVKCRGTVHVGITTGLFGNAPAAYVSEVKFAEENNEPK